MYLDTFFIHTYRNTMHYTYINRAMMMLQLPHIFTEAHQQVLRELFRRKGRHGADRCGGLAGAAPEQCSLLPSVVRHRHQPGKLLPLLLGIHIDNNNEQKMIRKIPLVAHHCLNYLSFYVQVWHRKTIGFSQLLPQIPTLCLHTCFADLQSAVKCVRFCSCVFKKHDENMEYITKSYKSQIQLDLN